MGKVFDEITDSLAAFIDQQQMFFVATAPLSAEGRVNLSPRGLDSFRVLDRQTVAFADLTGSGAETIAHLRENGRITVMFCAFRGAPKILRLQGQGVAVLPEHEEFASLAERLPRLPGVRAIIKIDCQRISDSCGYGVPEYEFLGERTQLTDYCERKGPDGLAEYRAEKNRQSIDGLPALE